MASPNQPNNPQQPPVPTMTSASMVPPLEEVPLRPFGAPADELAEDIVARPLGAPDFANDVKPFLVNPNLHPRWIFTDRRRFSQAIAQGWRVAKKADLKPGYAKLSPFEAEGGTKYINGDLILMLIDRKIYLGALRYKHQVAAAFADAAVQRRISAGRAVSDLGGDVAAANQSRIRQGADPVMTVFTPGAADLPGVMSNPANAAKELGRIGNAGRDTGTLASLAQQVDPNKT
jgi:hypothetical protein